MSFRLGLYGGTFDPVHNGHLIGARDALEQCGLDAIVWIPCARSPHKVGAASAPASDADRLAMLRLALRGEKRFWVSPIELKRGGPSYAIETALEFRAALPGAELFWLIGADQLPKLATWHRATELKKLLTFLLLDRPGSKTSRLPKGVLALPQPRWIDIAATEIRTRAKRGEPLDFLVPPSVATYIAKKPLYR